MLGAAAACGVLATLASLFKLSKREEVVQHAPSVLHSLKACNTLSSTNPLLRKLSIKLAQVGSDNLCLCVASRGHVIALGSCLSACTSGLLAVPARTALSG